MPQGHCASLEVSVPLPIPLDGFLDAQQHGGEPLVQAGDGVKLLHLVKGREAENGPRMRSCLLLFSSSFVANTLLFLALSNCADDRGGGGDLHTHTVTFSETGKSPLGVQGFV